MSEFAIVYRGLETPASPEQAQKTLEKWRAWFDDLEAKGQLKDFGHPLEDTGKLVTGRQKTVNDGPYAEAKDLIGGFSIIEAKDLTHATELAKSCPILEGGGSVEVRPIRAYTR